MTAADRTSLITTLNALTAAGSTPLCETAWETYLYLTGGTRLYGISGDASDLPLRDTTAESGNKYISPMEECTNTYIIYMTDGEPTQDSAADSRVRTLTGLTAPKTCPTYGAGSTRFTSCLAPLAEYMATHDLDGVSTNGVQSAPMATIGFNVGPDATALLIDTATLPKPDGTPGYYSATNLQELSDSFNDILLGILSTESTFTSPAVAVDSFSRTESRDDVFFAMFEPASTLDWWGNLKKLKLNKIDGIPTYVDANGNNALDEDGAIQATARTFWSATTDGGKVAAGGVGELLQTRALTSRNILTNTGTNGALQAFNTTNVTATASGFADDAAMWAFWQASNAADFAASINYGWGYDVDDVDHDGIRSETRTWILGDILHSKPLTVNYGARGTFTEADPDLRIVVGTNDGMLHMFGNNDGIEDWAFFPKELGPVLTKRRKNIREAGKTNVYGVDGVAVNYTIDINKNGSIDGDDKVYLYVGLRRGGSRYYALDITDPDAPVFLWAISPGTAGFSELGQSWSTPIVTKIPGYKDNSGKHKAVLVFGGGYDTVKDDHATLATPSQDGSGRGIFVVDALTGAKVWSITPAANSATNMQTTGMVHSIAADVYTLDSNGDSLADRIYAGDTAGNLWRVDMPGDALPTASQDKWFIFKLFEAVEGTRTKRTDRRFFNKPDVVRTSISGAPVDVITIGTGDRTNPIAKDHPTDVNEPTTDDQFYMIKDRRTTLYREALDPADCDPTPKLDLRCDSLGPSDLYDITSNPLETGTDEQKSTAMIALNAAQGWRLDLTRDGEKNLSNSRTLDGKVEFNSFTPVIDVVGCGFASGEAWSYLVDLFNGSPEQDCDGDGTKELACRMDDTIVELSTLIVTAPGDPDDPDDDGGDIYTTGAPGGKPCNPCDTGSDMDGPYGSYWDREDY